MSVANRINHLKTFFDIPSDAALARIAGVSRATAGNWRKGTVPSPDALAQLRLKLQLNPDWIRQGKEPMLLPPEDPTDIQKFVESNLKNLSCDERKRAAADLIRLVSRFV